MSVRSNGSGDRLLCATALGLTTGAFTSMIYFKNLTDRNTFVDILGFGDVALDPATSLQTGTTANGTSIAAFGGGGTPTEHASALTTWYVVVLSRNGSNTLQLRIFADDASTTPIHTQTATDGVNYSALDNILVSTLFTGEWADAEYENCKIWIGAELTNAECRADASSYAVVRSTNSFLAVALKDTDADTDGLNGTVGGLNFTNTGMVNGASTPAQLTVAGGATVLPGTGALTYTGLAPTIVLPQVVLPTAGALTLTGLVPTVTGGAGAGVAVQVGLGQLTLTGLAPNPQQWLNLPLAETQSFAAEAFSFDVAVSVDVGVLTFTGFAPLIIAPLQVVSADAGALTLTGFAPTILTPLTLFPGAGQIVLTGFNPGVNGPPEGTGGTLSPSRTVGRRRRRVSAWM